MVAAYIFIELSATDLDKIVSQLRDIPGVEQAHILFGPTDCIAYVTAEDNESLGKTVMAIRGVHGVVNTDTRSVYI